MLERLSLDQLRIFVAAADEGSFSAAGRKLLRAQSVVSQTLANLEGQLGVQLFDRGGRYPRLTEQGAMLLVEARAVLRGVEGLRSRARAMAEGVEPELSVTVDVMFPMATLTCAVGSFREKFPHTPLRLYVEALGAVVKPVMEGVCRLGIMGTLPIAPGNIVAEPLLDVPMVTVASAAHPLARVRGQVPRDELQRHVQLVLTDRSSLTQGQSYGVFSPHIWHLADLGAKHAFLRAGFGWGHMPEAMVRADIARGDLALLELSGKGGGRGTGSITMQGIYRQDRPPGPAGRWFLDRLRTPEDAV